jgi:hypothetical protein
MEENRKIFKFSYEGIRGKMERDGDLREGDFDIPYECFDDDDLGCYQMSTSIMLMQNNKFIESIDFLDKAIRDGGDSDYKPIDFMSEEQLKKWKDLKKQMR